MSKPALLVVMLVLMTIPLRSLSYEQKDELLSEKLLSLETNASEGNERALYQLGFIYLQSSKVSEPDLDKAFQYFIKITGELKKSANIFIGYIYAKGTENLIADISKTETIFQDTSVLIENEWSELLRLGKNLNSLSEKEMMSYMERSIQVQQDQAFLCGYAREYEIEITLCE